MATRTISASLPEEVVYVSGTVNGAYTIWTKVKDNTWETVVDVDERGVYEVDLIMVDSAERTFNAFFTLFYNFDGAGEGATIWIPKIEAVTFTPDPGITNGKIIMRVWLTDIFGGKQVEAITCGEFACGEV